MIFAPVKSNRLAGTVLFGNTVRTDPLPLGFAAVVAGSYMG